MRSIGWLAVVSMLGVALLAPASASAAGQLTGAVWTSTVDGTIVNQNRYDNKDEVYLNGGPKGCQNSGLPAGDYYFQVTDPSGKTLLSSDAIKHRQVHVVNGVISGVSGDGDHAVGTGTCEDAKSVQLIPYDDTPNNGHEYKVELAPVDEVAACDGFDAETPFNFLPCKTSTKSDNFKVGEPNTAKIVVTKVIDADGDLSTDGDQTAGVNWHFGVEMSNGEVTKASPDTNADGIAQFGLEFDYSITEVVVTETLKDGYEIVDAKCVDNGSTREPKAVKAAGDPVGELNGLGIGFVAEPDHEYRCTFYNTKPETPINPALILVRKLIDVDGDPETTGDQVPAADWEYSVDAENGEVVDSDPVTDTNGYAGFLLDVTGESTGVTVSESVKDGFRILDVQCEEVVLPDSARSIDAARTARHLTAEGDPIGEADGDGISFDAAAGHAYYCEFINTSGEVLPTIGVPSPRITPPATDAIAGTSSPASDSWRMILVAMAGLLASILVLTPAPVRNRRK